MYFYATPNDSITAVGIHTVIEDDSSLAVFQAKVEEFQSSFGAARICDGENSFGENFDRRWQRDGHFVVAWAEVPPSGWNNNPLYLLTIAYLIGQVTCEKVPDAPLFM
jgi:hypothetical protein